MALPPTTPANDSDKQAAQQDVFLREVDDAVRQEELASFMRRFGKPLGAGVVLGLAALAGYLWWDSSTKAAAGEQAERYTIALDRLESGSLAEAGKDFAAIAKDGTAGSKASAAMMQAAMLLSEGKQAEAVKAFAALAANPDMPQAYRDLALIREIATGFDTIAPQQVVDRLKPLAVPGNAWFGSAGELVALAYLKQNKPDMAGPLYAAIAKDKGVPESLRSRARQMAGQLGVDAVDELIKTASDAEKASPAGAPAAAAPSAAAAPQAQP